MFWLWLLFWVNILSIFINLYFFAVADNWLSLAVIPLNVLAAWALWASTRKYPTYYN